VLVVALALLLARRSSSRPIDGQHVRSGCSGVKASRVAAPADSVGRLGTSCPCSQVTYGPLDSEIVRRWSPLQAGGRHLSLSGFAVHRILGLTVSISRNTVEGAWLGLVMAGMFPSQCQPDIFDLSPVLL